MQLQHKVVVERRRAMYDVRSTKYAICPLELHHQPLSLTLIVVAR